MFQHSQTKNNTSSQLSQNQIQNSFSLESQNEKYTNSTNQQKMKEISMCKSILEENKRRNISGNLTPTIQRLREKKLEKMFSQDVEDPEDKKMNGNCQLEKTMRMHCSQTINRYPADIHRTEIKRKRENAYQDIQCQKPILNKKSSTSSCSQQAQLHQNLSENSEKILDQIENQENDQNNQRNVDQSIVSYTLSDLVLDQSSIRGNERSLLPPEQDSMLTQIQHNLRSFIDPINQHLSSNSRSYQEQRRQKSRSYQEDQMQQQNVNEEQTKLKKFMKKYPELMFIESNKTKGKLHFFNKRGKISKNYSKRVFADAEAVRIQIVEAQFCSLNQKQELQSLSQGQKWPKTLRKLTIVRVLDKGYQQQMHGLQFLDKNDNYKFISHLVLGGGYEFFTAVLDSLQTTPLPSIQTVELNFNVQILDFKDKKKLKQFSRFLSYLVDNNPDVRVILYTMYTEQEIKKLDERFWGNNFKRNGNLKLEKIERIQQQKEEKKEQLKVQIKREQIKSRQRNYQQEKVEKRQIKNDFNQRRFKKEEIKGQGNAMKKQKYNEQQEKIKRIIQKMRQEKQFKQNRKIKQHQQSQMRRKIQQGTNKMRQCLNKHYKKQNKNYQNVKQHSQNLKTFQNMYEKIQNTKRIRQQQQRRNNQKTAKKESKQQKKQNKGGNNNSGTILSLRDTVIGDNIKYGDTFNHHQKHTKQIHYPQSKSDQNKSANGQKNKKEDRRRQQSQHELDSQQEYQRQLIQQIIKQSREQYDQHPGSSPSRSHNLSSHDFQQSQSNQYQQQQYQQYQQYQQSDQPQFYDQQ